jgi:phage gpG-like protein
MATPNLTVKINDRRLKDLSASLAKDLRGVVKTAAFRIERRAKEVPPPIDTGATRNSIHVSMNDGSGSYAAASSAARGAKPGVKLLPESQPGGSDGLSARIGPSTSYAAGLEFGGPHTPARPFMAPSLEAERRPFEGAVANIFKKA